MTKAKSEVNLNQIPTCSWNSPSAYGKVLVYFFTFPTATVSLNELVSKLSISKTAAHVAIQQLVKEDFLTKKVIGRSWLISCNQQHQYTITRKVAYFLGLILDSELVFRIRKNYPQAKAIILFGSYRKGDSAETSDVDIAVELPGSAPQQIIEFGVLKELGYRKNVLVTLHLFSHKNITKTLFANIANGVVLDGFLEVES